MPPDATHRAMSSPPIDYAVSRGCRVQYPGHQSIDRGAPSTSPTLVDPLTLAAERAVRRRHQLSSPPPVTTDAVETDALQYGGITAPGNAPWVLTVGASSHMGTAARADDTIAPFRLAWPHGFRSGRQARRRCSRRWDRVSRSAWQHSLRNQDSVSRARSVADRRADALYRASVDRACRPRSSRGRPR